jgi:hypothetical protein
MTAREPSPSTQLSALLSRFPPEIVALAKKCLPKLRRAVPCTHLTVYDYSHSIVVGFGLSEKGYEAIVVLAVYPSFVRLYFGNGKSLPDPNGLLQGSAGVRYVPLGSASDLDRADIRALFKAAIKHRGVTFPRGRSTRMVIKSKSKKRTPRRTGRA